MTGRQFILAACVAFLAVTSFAAPPGPKRAVLIGIDDYSASGLRMPADAAVTKRDWSNLDGAVNDVRLMREILIARHEFAPADIVMLTDQQATRVAMERAVTEHLLRPAKRGDVLLFYYSGHGSQVRNSRSTEADKLDESLVPADSRLGVRDIRDKELRALFNRMLDRGARLTVVLDACHSASGARGLDGGLRHRGVSPDIRDVADASNDSRPEDRGALVIAASEDFDLAYETLDPEEQIRGAFSWAFARSLRDADPGEAVGDTFLRSQALLRTEMPAQNPVLAGRADVRIAPFLGTTGERGSVGRAIAIANVSPEGTCTLLGGWVHGLTVGTRLRVADGIELEVTSLVGAGRAEARVARDHSQRGPIAAEIRPGALLEISTWAAPASRNLRAWIPRAFEAAAEEARKLVQDTTAGGMRAIDDPTEITPTQLFRRRDRAWERISAGSGTTFFVQVPPTPTLAGAFGDVDGVDLVDGPETADYILTGRITRTGVEYAWVRPRVTVADSERSAMPLRSAWMPDSDSETTALALRMALVRLIRVHGWHELQSPAGGGSHYRLAVRDALQRTLIESGPLMGGREYQLVLRLREPRTPTLLYSRYVYAFVVDSHGRSILLFPRPESGSVENLLPLTKSASEPIADPPEEIALGASPSFRVSAPYGMDAYFLLSTDTPLSSTSCLEWDGVRAVPSAPRTALELLLSQSAAGTRGQELLQTSPNWSIEKIVFQSVPPRRASR